MAFETCVEQAPNKPGKKVARKAVWRTEHVWRRSVARSLHIRRRFCVENAPQNHILPLANMCGHKSFWTPLFIDTEKVARERCPRVNREGKLVKD